MVSYANVAQDVDAVTEDGRVEQPDRSPQKSLRLHRLDAPPHRRGRTADALCQVDVADRRVQLQDRKDAPIDIVDGVR